jgi:hypothetical protein
MALPKRFLLGLAGGAGAALAAVRARAKVATGATSGETTPSATGPTPPADLAAAATPEPVRATPPDDLPGPSVTPSTGSPDDVGVEELLEPDVRDVVAEEEAAAAAEAAAIGGEGGAPEVEDEAMRPVYEGGGGEAEGFELAERDLVENATHGDGHGNPLRDAFRAEVEPSGAVYGEADDVKESDRDAREPGADG